jgi:hypothetical protein
MVIVIIGVYNYNYIALMHVRLQALRTDDWSKLSAIAGLVSNFSESL